MRKRFTSFVGKKNSWKKISRLAALAPAVFITARTMGGTFTWSGASSTSWSDAGNWTAGSGFPASTVSDYALFNGPSANTNVTMDMGGNSVNSITFDGASTPTYTIGSSATFGAYSFEDTNRINIGSGGITVNANVTTDQHIYGPVRLTGPATFTNNGTGNLVIGDPTYIGNSNSDYSLSNYLLTIDGTGNTVFNGGGIGGGITKNGTGTFTYQPAIGSTSAYVGHSIGGSITVNKGTFAMARGGGITSSWSGYDAAIFINSGGTFDMGGLSQNYCGPIQSSPSTAGGTLTSSQPGALWGVAGNITGTYNFSGTINGPILLDLSQGSPNNYTQILSGTGDFGNTGGTAITFGSGTSVIINGNYTIRGSIFAQATLSGTGTLNMADGSVYIGNPYYGNGGTIRPGDPTQPNTIGKLSIAVQPGQSVSISTYSGYAPATYACDVGATTSDDIAVTGTLSLGGAQSELDINALAGAFMGTTYTIAEFTTLTGTFGTVTGLPGNYSLVYDPNSIELVPGGAPPSATWTNTGITSGSWDDGTKWTPLGAPNASGAVANFTGADFGTSGAGIVTLTANQTVGILNINSSSGNAVNYTFNSAGGTLVIDDASDPVTPNPSINVSGGSHVFNVPIQLNNGVTWNLSNSTAVAVNNTISGTGPMTVTGLGTLSIGTAGKLNSTSSLSVLGGATVALAPVSNVLAPNVQTVASLTVDGTSLLDLSNNQMMVTNATEASVMGQLAAGYGPGSNWAGTHGITSSTAAADPGHAIGYVASGSGVFMMYTLAGDATLDGTVNFNDLLALAGNYTSTTADWAEGDFNYDGTVNFSDLLLLAGNYTATLTGDPSVSSSFAADWALAEAEVAAVPEPTSFGLLAVGAAGLLARWRRNRNLK